MKRQTTTPERYQGELGDLKYAIDGLRVKETECFSYEDEEAVNDFQQKAHNYANKFNINIATCNNRETKTLFITRKG